MSSTTNLPPTATGQTTAYGIPIRNLWYMLLYAWQETPRSPYWQMTGVEESPSLDALLAYCLSTLLQQRLRIGLGCSYMPEQQTLRGVRGRIQLTHSLKQRSFERGQVVCQFEQYSVNAPKNQIIRSTLFYLAQRGELGPDRKRAEGLRHTLRRLVWDLDGIDLIELTPELIHRQQAERHDRDYRIMLSICDLVLQRRMPTEEAGHFYLSQLERDRLLLHRVYETFVANFYRYHLSEWIVLPQKSLAWHEKLPSPYLPTMKPDLCLQEKSTGRLIVLDTKFTAKSLVENRWGKEIFNPSHLYQIYAYLSTQDHLSQHHRQATGILLYPAVRDELSEHVELLNHQIRIECVNLVAPWQYIEQRLLSLIQECAQNSAN